MTYTNLTATQIEVDAMREAIMMGTADVAALLAGERFSVNQKMCIEFAARASKTEGDDAVWDLHDEWGVALDRICGDDADTSELTGELVTMADACVEAAMRC